MRTMASSWRTELLIITLYFIFVFDRLLYIIIIPRASAEMSRNYHL